MPIDVDQIVSAPFPALVLALVGLGLFVTGAIVPGRLVKDMLQRFDRMAAALEERNRIDADRLSRDREHDERRSRLRAGDG